MPDTQALLVDSRILVRVPNQQAQDARKNAGLEIADRIVLKIEGTLMVRVGRLGWVSRVKYQVRGS